MESAQETELVPVPDPTTKRTYHRRATWRYNEDGTYNKKPNDPEYFKNYYQEKSKGVRFKCECGGVFLKTGISRHRNSKYCKDFWLKRALHTGNETSLTEVEIS